MWKPERCAQGARKRAQGWLAIIATVVLALAVFARSSHAAPSHETLLVENGAVTPLAADPVAQELRRFVDDATWHPGIFRLEWSRLRSFYSRRAFRPVWTTPDEEARVRVVLAHADREGLAPDDYMMGAIQRPENDDPAKLAKYDLLLSNALLQYASDVRVGRVAAGAGEFDVDLPAQHYNAVDDLEKALSRGTLADYLAALPPVQNEYRVLRDLLA